MHRIAPYRAVAALMLRARRATQVNDQLIIVEVAAPIRPSLTFRDK